MHVVSRRWILLAAGCMAGCTVSDSRVASDSTNDSTRDSTGAATAALPSTTAPPSTAAPGMATPSDTASLSAGRVTFSAVPPLRIGMSASEARRALGLPLSPAKNAPESCRYLDTKGKSHAFVMLENDTIVRFDIRDSSLVTAAGARVGDSEARIRSLYRGQVTEQPHKYVQGGHYLVVATPSDTALRLVFETEGARVTRFRVGRRPAVEYVEGCG
jgi:hypothetical protein